MMFEDLERRVDAAESRVDAAESGIVLLIKETAKAKIKVMSIESNCFIATWLSAIALVIGFAAFLIAIFK